jgi:hypothetical protein
MMPNKSVLPMDDARRLDMVMALLDEAKAFIEDGKRVEDNIDTARALILSVAVRAEVIPNV